MENSRNPNEKGLFVTFEGGEGTGKSTQVKLLAEYLRSVGEATLVTREPGGSVGAEAIRDLLVTGAVDKWTLTTEVLLLYAARADHFEKSIKPALLAGKTVICDRFADSTLAYQGYGKGFDLGFSRELYAKAVGTREPDLTFILDINVKTGLKRAKARLKKKNSKESRFENMDESFHEAARKGFLTIAEQNPKRCEVIDGTLSKEAIHARIVERLKEFKANRQNQG